MKLAALPEALDIVFEGDVNDGDVDEEEDYGDEDEDEEEDGR